MSTRKKVLWWIGGTVFVIYALFPIAWIISISLKQPSDIANGQFLPTAASWVNYETILTGSASDLFLPALRNSFGSGPTSSMPGAGRISLTSVSNRSASPLATRAIAPSEPVSRSDFGFMTSAMPSVANIRSIDGRLAPLPA